MSKKLMSIIVQGKTSKFCFLTYVEPEFLSLYQEEGIDINIVENIFPEWVSTSITYTRIWCFFQDLFNFKNPFRKK